MRIMPGGALEQDTTTSTTVSSTTSHTSCFVGQKLEEHRGAFVLDYPMDKGFVVDGQWDAMERVYEVSLFGVV